MGNQTIVYQRRCHLLVKRSCGVDTVAVFTRVGLSKLKQLLSMGQECVGICSVWKQRHSLSRKLPNHIELKLLYVKDVK